MELLVQPHRCWVRPEADPLGGQGAGGTLAQVAYEEQCCWEKPVREAAERWGRWGAGGGCGTCRSPTQFAPSGCGFSCGRLAPVWSGGPAPPTPCHWVGITVGF